MMKSLFSIVLVCLCACLQAELIYEVDDLGLSAVEHSEARSLNYKGSVAGKMYEKNKVSDFLWEEATGLHLITSSGIKDAYPCLNNHGQVAGIFIDKAKSSWCYERPEIYFYDQKTGLRNLGIPSGWEEEGVSVIGINDGGCILVANHIDRAQADKFALWEKDHFLTFPEDSPICDINQRLVYLVQREDHSLFGSSSLELSSLKFSKPLTLSQNKGDRGLSVNDKGCVIGIRHNGSQGFFWSLRTNFVDLGSLLPVALNRYGQIVGKDACARSLLLRQPDASLVDLNALSLVGEKPVYFDEVWDISDNGHLLVSSRKGPHSQVFLLKPLK